MNHVFTEQPAHEDLAGPGPYVTFRVTKAKGGQCLRMAKDGPGYRVSFPTGEPEPEPEWVDVALPFERLPVFYWAALLAGYDVDVGALIPECRAIGYDLLGATGPERRGHLLRVERKDGLTVLIATNPVEWLARGLQDD